MLFKIYTFFLPLYGLMPVSLGNEQCPPGEVYTTCGSPCPKTCSSDPGTFCPALCVAGCFCPPGKIKNDQGVCVSPEECPNKCKCGEIYESCGTACPPTCSNPKPGVCTEQCVAGCFCPKEKLRDEASGRCVSSEDCDKCTKEEIFKKNSTSYPPTCKKPNPPHCNETNITGCFCPQGQVRDEKSGACVYPENCNKCPTGEVYSTCGPENIRTCEKPESSTELSTTKCVEGCFCPEGQVRQQYGGRCICAGDCTKCPVGEVYNSCGTACPLTCDEPKLRPCTKQCVPGCYCKKGELRDEITNKCVRPDKCFKCPAGEVFTKCGAACTPTCDNPKPEICLTICMSGCICDNGTVRDTASGKCVKVEECHKCPAGEEYKQCGAACPPTCINPKPIKCPEICLSGCICANGTVRDPLSGKCVTPNKCPKCPEGEVLSECGGACTPTCTNRYPICPLICLPGCICKPGTIKDQETGKCIPPDNCTCPDGEHYEKCGTACPPTCSNPEPTSCTKNCKPGCYCNNGTVRDENANQCVPLDLCGKCPEGQEYSECGSACPPTCQERNPQLCTLQCVTGCFCKNGLVNDTDTGKCVPEKKCPPLKCKDGEEYKACGPSCQATCSDRDPICDQKCTRGCFCPSGQVRDNYNNMTCIPEDQCPQN